MRRRAFLTAVMAAPAQAQETPRERQPGQEIAPILFVHGNGDNAAQWLPTIWRFESNFYPRARLFAVDLRLPAARRVDAQRDPGRSSVEEATAQLAQEVARVRRASGLERVLIIAHSRAGNLVRHWLRLNPGQRLRGAVLCGAPCHGIIVSDTQMVGSEFNGASPYLRALNAMPGEVPPGVPVFTLASDRYDIWAQPDGRFLGLPGVATGVDFAGPSLRGATNIVLSGVDHLETAYSTEAFVELYRIATGELPQTTRIRPEVRPNLSGRISAYMAGVPTNIGTGPSRLRIFAVEPGTGRRLGPERFERVTGVDGAWGPFEADSEQSYEFEVTVRGYPITHIYRPPLPRGTENLHLRPYLPGSGDPKSGALIVVTRPRGFFDLGRDRIQIGEQAVGGEPDVPHENTLRARAPEGAQVSTKVVFNTETIGGLSWPAQGHVTVIEIGE